MLMDNTLADGLQELVSCGFTTEHAEYLLRHPLLVEEIIAHIEETATVQHPDGTFKDKSITDVECINWLGISGAAALYLSAKGVRTIDDIMGLTAKELAKKVGSMRSKQVIAGLANKGITLPEK